MEITGQQYRMFVWFEGVYYNVGDEYAKKVMMTMVMTALVMSKMVMMFITMLIMNTKMMTMKIETDDNDDD